MNELKPKSMMKQVALIMSLLGITTSHLSSRRRKMTAPSGNGDGCIGRIWKKQIHFCSIT